VSRETETPVTIQPEGKTVHVLPGSRLVEALGAAGVVVDQPCGGKGTCGKCRLRVTSGATAPTEAERKRLSAEELDAGWRLACQAEVGGATEVEVPDGSRPAARHQIVARFAGPDAAAADDPPVRKRYVELPAPCRGDDLPDLRRLQRALGPFGAAPELLRELPRRLRECGFRGTAVLAGERLVDFEPGDTAGACFAAAVDLGTTTLVVALLDVATGRELAVASRLNPQTRFGDDVIARIAHATEVPGGLEQLQRAAAGAADEMIGEVCRAAGVPRQRIYEVVVSGNTTMQQLFCRIDPQWLGCAPFAAATGPGVALPAAELGLTIHPRGEVYVMPVIGGFVGGDAVAGILATALADWPKPALLIDVGTNGELVLSIGGKLTAASAAAGPAFEGARISCGMRGSTGAIEKVAVDGRLRINVIGDVRPSGLCGSGLIDAVAVLLEHRLLAPRGRLRRRDELPDDVPDDLARRLVVHDGQAAFLLASGDEAAGGKPLVLTQRDLREMQLATGAMRAGATILLRRAGLQPTDLDAVLLAGGFGSFIRRSNAQRIGLLPAEIEHHCIRYQGNTSLAGARLAALSRTARRAADELAARAEHVDLSTDPEFHRTFAESMIFPARG
jgi:uncharacterized 2Fe-2S/4Fe-4S cluster protein (DUF4445 family)